MERIKGGGGVFNAGGTLDIDNADITDNLASGATAFMLDGGQEVPANLSTATGDAIFQIDVENSTFRLDLFVEGIALADLTASPVHIHAAPTGVNGGIIVNFTTLGITFTEEDGGLRLLAEDVAISAGLFDDLLDGETYINVHTTAFPSGEIRGQMTFPMTMGSGGGILNDLGTLVVTDTTISGNVASRAGGGIETNGGTATLTDVTLDANITDPRNPLNAGASAATPGYGGGLHVGGGGTATVNTSTFTNNEAIEGGGLWVGSSSTLDVNQSTVGTMGAGNTATEGGGLYNSGGTLNIDQTTIAYNTASADGGGIGQGTAPTPNLTTITNSTISNNTADDNGGGIYSDAGTINVDSATIAANSTLAFLGGGGIYATGTGVVNLGNTIVGDQATGMSDERNFGGELANDIATGGGGGTVNSDDFNIVSDGTFVFSNGNQPDDQIGGDPNLSPLADNGGPTFTHLPAGDALDTGDTTLAVDQRDLARPSGTQDDVGAVEVQAFSAIIDNGEAGFSTVGSWTAKSNPVARDGDVHHSLRGTGDDVATWTFTGLSTGSYLVSATWQAHANRGTNSPFSAYDGIGGSLLSTMSLDQQMSPDDFSDSGSTWENLFVVAITGDTLVIELSDAANGYVIADGIRIEQTTDAAPVDARIIDNGDAGFVTSGVWNPAQALRGHENDLVHNVSGDGSDTATWTFTGLIPGDYMVSATWFAHANRATDAPFSILDGIAGPTLATVLVDQELSPDDFTDLGTDWENLMTVTITSSELVVSLSDDANEYVIADAIRIEPVIAP